MTLAGGGALKRTADGLISLQYDISTLQLMYEALAQKERSTEFFFNHMHILYWACS